MIFVWPMVLWALAVVPLLIAGYLVLIYRKRCAAERYAAWMPAGTTARRTRVAEHLPAVLMLLSIIALIGAMARPNAVLTLPSLHDTVILAIDVSGSMKATDIAPTRLAAAQAAAKDFINRQPKTTQIGIVAFANTALVVQRPTTSREDLLEAVERLQPQEGTTVGGAIVVSLQTLFPKEEIELLDPREKKERDQAMGPPKDPPKTPAAPGSEQSSAIEIGRAHV